MKSHRASIARVTILLAFIAVALPMLPVHAQVDLSGTSAPVTAETPFAGIQLYTMTCTCSGNVLIVLYDYYSMMPLALVYQPGVSVLYSYFNIWGKYYLGSYQRGMGSCKMVTPVGCPDIYTNGMMGFLPGTGTSAL